MVMKCDKRFWTTFLRLVKRHPRVRRGENISPRRVGVLSGPDPRREESRLLVLVGRFVVASASPTEADLRTSSLIQASNVRRATTTVYTVQY